MFHRTASGEPRLAQVLGALSHTLDLAAGRAPGHALRTCWVGMWLGRALGVRDEKLYELYYALLLADAGRGAEDTERAVASDGGGLFERVGRLLRLTRTGDRRAGSAPNVHHGFTDVELAQLGVQAREDLESTRGAGA
ncbi:MAG TPA: hypothetical protein VMT18_03900 [Planctomycetota bacterium]|nr:hypothetical protein [Planctomycetota bacterium]